MESHPSKEEDTPAAEREANLAVLLDLCCVLKDGMCRLGTAQKPWQRGKAGMETELALHPLGQARWLWAATTQRSPDFSKWHRDSVEDSLAFYDACSVKLRLSHILLLFPGTSMVN